ncbi:MAG: hypothetical protein IT455_13435, partial [Planctomycetes bacterium]|nr:hypothetical protein [Planctomycetota bacterium]
MKSALVLLVLFFGCAKFLSPEPGTMASWAYYSVATMEIGLGSALLTRYWRGAALALVVFFLVGCAVALVDAGPCGCGGGLLRLDRTWRLIVASIGGVLASVVGTSRVRADVAGWWPFRDGARIVRITPAPKGEAESAKKVSVRREGRSPWRHDGSWRFASYTDAASTAGFLANNRAQFSGS